MRCFVLLVALTVLVSVLSGCGGGFSRDSSNAGEIAPTIFGTASDTTVGQ
jgi:uncharacterized protein YceK